MKISFTCFILVLIFTVNLFSQSPVLVSPVNGQTDLPINYTFEWSEVPDATYRLEISIYSAFYWNQIDVSDITTTSYDVTGLYMYVPYYWRVTATTSGGSTVSSVGTYTTGASTGVPTPPALLQPSDNSTDIATSYSFIWNYVAGATYHLQISTESSFTLTQLI